MVSAAPEIVNVSALVAVAPLESFTCTVKFAVAGVVGVPEMVPPALSVSPVGSAPAETVHALPPAPPLAASVCEYANPTLPFGSDVVVTVKVAAATVMLNAFEAVCPPLSVTVAVKFAVPGDVGVPLTLPSPPRVSPAGNAPFVTAQVLPPVPPLADSEAEYATPTVPFGS